MERDGDLKKIIAFPEAGEGVVLLFYHRDCVTLQQRLGEKWLVDLPERMDRLDTVVIEQCLQTGGKGPGDKGLKVRPIKLDELEDITMGEIATRCLDAVYLCVHGKTWLAYQEDILRRMAKAQEQGQESPQSSPEISSASSSELPSGPESSQPS